MTQRDNNISYQIDSILTVVSQDQVQEDKQIRQINEDHLLIKEEPYQLVLNYREGFDLLAFENRYQEYFEKFDFIVGDWGFEQLRLRGFYQIGQAKVPKDQTIDFLEDYLNEYCNFGCRYFVLAKEREVAKYAKLKDKAKTKPAPIEKKVGETKQLAKIQVKEDPNRFKGNKVDAPAKGGKKPFKKRNRRPAARDQAAPKQAPAAAKQRKNNFVIKQKNKTNP